MLETQNDNHPEKKLTFFKENKTLLENYENWNDSLAEEEKIFLIKQLRSANKNLWFTTCYEAVKTQKEEWLSGFAVGEEKLLPFPFSRFSKSSDIDKRRKCAAICIANCAIAAILLKNFDSLKNTEQKTKFINCIKQAITFWQKTNDSSATIIIQEFLFSDFPNNQANSERFLDTVIEYVFEQHSNYEILPVKDLIHYFLTNGRNNGWEQEKISKAKFPLVDTINDKAKIGQLEIERRAKGKGQLYRDPITMSFSPVNIDFQKSIKDAFEFIQTQYNEFSNYDFRWRVRDWSSQKKKEDVSPIIDGVMEKKSVGLAAAIAFNQSKHNGIGDGFVFTGIVRDNGKVSSVSSYDRKFTAHPPATTLPIFVPSEDYSTLDNLLELGYDVRAADSVLDVTQQIEEAQKRKRKRQLLIKYGLPFLIILISAIVGLGSWGYYNENQRRQIAEYEEKVSHKETEGLKVLTSELHEKNEELIKTNGQLEIAKGELTKTNGQLEDAKEKLEIANDKLGKKNKVLISTNKELDIAKKDADKQRDSANQQKEIAVLNEQEAQKQRNIAQASQQVAYASRLAAEGYKRLADGDKNSAQTYFAKALSLDDRDEYRSGLLNASLNEPIKTKLSWSGNIGDDSEGANSVSSASLNVSGEMLAVSYGNGQNVRIINTQDGTEVTTFPFEHQVTAVALSPNGKYLAARTAASKLVILDLITKKTYFETDAQVNDHQDVITFNSDGKYLATAFSNNQVLILDVENRQIIKRFSHAEDLPNAEILSLAFSSKNYLAYGFTILPYKLFNDSPIFISAINDKSVTKKIDSSGINVNLGFTKNGLITSSAFINIFASVSSDFSSNVSYSGGLTVFDDIEDNLTAQEQPESHHLNQKVRPEILFASVPNSDYFVSTGDHGYIRFWDGEKQLQQISFPMGKPVKIMMGENGRILFLNSKGKIFCWETNVNNSYEGKNKSFESWSSILPPKTITVYDDAIVVTDFKTDEKILSFKRNKTPEDDTKVAVSPDGNKIGVLLERKFLEVYDADTRSKIFQYVFDNKIDACCLKFSNDGRKLAVAWSTISYNETQSDSQSNRVAQSNSVDIFDLLNSAIESKIKLPMNLSKTFYLGESNFSPKGNFYVIRSDDSIFFFDLLTGKLKQSVPYQQAECELPMSCSSFAISPDEKYVGITYLQNQTVELWNLDNYRYLIDVIKTGITSPELPVGVGFSKNSQLLVWSSGNSGRLHFYDVKNNRKLADFPTDEMIFSLTNALDGNLIVNQVNRLDENNLNLLLFGSPSVIKSEMLNKYGFKINSQDYKFMPQDYINSILPERHDFELVAVTKNSAEEKGDSAFGGVEVMKVKTNADGTSTQCPTAFTKPIFNPYVLMFKSRADFCSHYPVIDVRKAQGGRYSENKQSWLSTKYFNTGDDFFILMYMSNGAANNLSGDVVDAKNVKINVKINSIGKDEYILSATFLGDNLAPLTSTVKVEVPQGNHLAYSNNIEIYDYLGKAPPLKVIDVSKAKIQDGKNLSFEISIGNLEPGFATDLFIKFPVSVKQD